MDLKNAPCHGCEQREYGCHSHCETYSLWKIAKDRHNEEQYAERNAMMDMNAYRYNKDQKMRKIGFVFRRKK